MWLAGHNQSEWGSVLTWAWRIEVRGGATTGLDETFTQNRHTHIEHNHILTLRVDKLNMAINTYIDP